MTIKYFVIIFILLIIILFITIYKKYETFKQCEENLILNKEEINELKNIYIELTQYLNKNNIDYFAIGGTLIGTVRNGGLMPNDDDIDIGILKTDNVIKVFNNYKNNNYYFEEYIDDKYSFGYKFKSKNNDRFIDIMLFELKDNAYRIINNCFENEYFYVDEIYPLIKSKYSDLDINIPNGYIKHLDRVFGDWETTIKIVCNPHHNKHDKNICEINNLPIEFNIDDYDGKYLCYTPFD